MVLLHLQDSAVISEKVYLARGGSSFTNLENMKEASSQIETSQNNFFTFLMLLGVKQFSKQFKSL